MSGTEILVDTNILIYLLQGENTLSNVLQGRQLYISFITELELIGFKHLSEQDEIQINALLEQCIIVDFSIRIKNHYKVIRKTSNLKLPDSIVAATAIALNLPLISADKQFHTIADLNLIRYNNNFSK